jgi:U3 small nucleolar RNA-associated protein 14
MKGVKYMKADYNISYDELKEIRDALNNELADLKKKKEVVDEIEKLEGEIDELKNGSKNREKGDICKEYHKKQCESCIYKNLNDIFNKKEKKDPYQPPWRPYPEPPIWEQYKVICKVD